MNIPTFQEIQNMTEEEVKELNRKLAIRAFGKFAGVMMLKWLLIFWATRAARKWIENMPPGTFKGE